MQTRKRSLREVSSGDADVRLPPTLVEPSKLHLPTPERCISSAPSTPAGTQHSDHSEGPSVKRQRKRNTAKTPADIKAREDERAARNRRAAQESRERKRQLFESLESDNERLRQENQALKERLASLEACMEKLESQEAVVEEVKEEDPAQTHCPAVVMSRDQQCQAESPRSFQPTTLFTTPSTSFHCSLNLASSISPFRHIKTTFNFYSIPYRISIRPNLTTTSTFPRRPRSQPFPLAYLSRVCATLDSLNSGSLESGAKFWVSSEARCACDPGRFGSWYLAIGLFFIAAFTKCNQYNLPNPAVSAFHLPDWFGV